MEAVKNEKVYCRESKEASIGTTLPMCYHKSGDMKIKGGSKGVVKGSLSRQCFVWLVV